MTKEKQNTAGKPDKNDPFRQGNGRMRNDRKTVSRGTAEKPHNSDAKTRRTQTPSPESYQEEIRGKHDYLVKLLGKYGRVEPVIAMEDPLHYRNKVHAVFGRDGSGRIRCGEYKEGLKIRNAGKSFRRSKNW